MKHAYTMTRAEFIQSDLPSDEYGHILEVGDKAKFMTLYGYREVVIKNLNKDEDGWFIIFDPIQVGPEKAFKPISQWHIKHMMMQVRFAGEYKIASREWLNSIAKGLGGHYCSVMTVKKQGVSLRPEVLADYKKYKNKINRREGKGYK